MKKASVLKLLLLLAAAHAAAADDAALLQLPNMREPQQNRIVSGTLDAADLGRLRAAGIKHVISLRTAEESQGFDEAAIAAGLGIRHHSIPIKGAQSLNRQNAEKLDELLREIGDDPALVHCGSGNRVGALIAVRKAWIEDASTEDAIAEGKRWGLTSLEEAVRAVLNDSSTAQPP